MMTGIAALLALAAAIAAWLVAAAARGAARVQLRFAAVLLAACAAAAVATPTAASAVAILVLPIVVAVLALAARAGFEQAPNPFLSSAMLGAASLCGITSAITGLALFALVASIAGVVVLLVICSRQFERARLASVQGGLAALCLLAALSVFATDEVGPAFLLFAAAGLLGVTLALSRSDVAIDNKTAGDLRAAIDGRRPG
jgi:hypothetical protein